MNFDIFGIGIDIVENERIKKILENYGEKFLYKIFSKKEIQFAKSKFELNDFFENKSILKPNIINFFAKRFAAKEALSKALGTGFSQNQIKISIDDISVLSDDFGCPLIEVSKTSEIKEFIIRKIKKEIRDLRFLVSLSDEKCYSIAQVQILIYF
jgi:holo-[acyl-carrier protein] synthase